MLNRFAKTVRAEMLRHRAANLAAHEDYVGAAATLDEIGNLYETKFPTLKFFPAINIQYAWYNSYINKETCFHNILFILNNFDKMGNIKNYYNISERDWLQYFCKLLLVNLTEFSDSEAFALARSIRVTYPTLRLTKVRFTIRRSFPMDPAAGIALDQFITANP